MVTSLLEAMESHKQNSNTKTSYDVKIDTTKFKRSPSPDAMNKLNKSAVLEKELDTPSPNPNNMSMNFPQQPGDQFYFKDQRDTHQNTSH